MKCGRSIIHIICIQYIQLFMGIRGSKYDNNNNNRTTRLLNCVCVGNVVRVRRVKWYKFLRNNFEYDYYIIYIYIYCYRSFVARKRCEIIMRVGTNRIYIYIVDRTGCAPRWKKGIENSPSSRAHRRDTRRRSIPIRYTVL